MRLHAKPKQNSFVIFPAETHGDLYREATQLIHLMYMAITLSDNSRLSRPVGTLMVLTSPTRTTAQARVGKWQTRVVRYSKDHVTSFSDPSISRATPKEHNKLSELYRSGGNCYLPHLVTPRRVEGRWSRPAGNSPRPTNRTGSYRNNSCLYSLNKTSYSLN